MQKSSESATAIQPSQYIVQICSRFLAYGLPLLYFLVVTSFYLKTYDSAQIKITFTQLGTILLLLVWGIKYSVAGEFPFSKQDFFFVAPFLCFLASGLISFLHSPFKAWAWEETSRRVFYMALSLITISELKSDESMARLFRWLMAAAWVSVGYGFIQYIDSRFFPAPAAGIDPFIWRQAFSHRVFSTFGNPNFYGNFLVIMTPLILSAVLRNKGPLSRPFLLLVVTLILLIVVDKMTRGIFGGFDPSYRVVGGAFIIVLFAFFLFLATWKLGRSSVLSMFLIFFCLLFLNLYSTETKGAWLGFMAATGATMFLILEYFLHLDDRLVNEKKYLSLIVCLVTAFSMLILLMVLAFVVPLLKGQVNQTGFQILWIPTLLAGILSIAMMVWVIKKPWNLKKIIYGFLLFFILALGGGVLQFAKNRLTSVSFRIFTWISTWEMIQTNPLLGNGVGTFKVIYPAFRRPEIIVLEGRSNTETDHAEDEYLEVWQDEGIIGFGIFLWLVFTAIILGLKQLRWYSLLRVPDGNRKRKLFDIESNPRSYEVLGYLGAYIGALIHWAVDVSIRFVSSGIFSGLLPGVLVAYARNHQDPIKNDIRIGNERWVRAAVALSWTMILFFLRVELVPQSQIMGGDTTDFQINMWIFLSGILIFLLLEFLEFGLSPATEEVVGKTSLPSISNRFIPMRVLLGLGFLVLGSYGLIYFGRHFYGDVYHNMAIFFSKEGLWTKSPAYDARIQSFPPDIRKKYQKIGGALEHYAAVNKNNHAFPMAHYFTGNVYNDWGSQVFAESINTRSKGDIPEAERLRDKAKEMWDKSEQAYNGTKKLAPNYVQTHHQMGILQMKRGELANQWGDVESAKKYFSESLKNFKLYRLLDPVFPQNYDRIAQLLIMEGKSEEAFELYKDAIYYNDVVCRLIHNRTNSDRLSSIALSMAKIKFSLATQKTPNPFNPISEEINEALKYFQMSTDNDPKNAEAWKGLGFLLEKLGKPVESQAAYRQAHALTPNDPDWKVNSAQK